jgi:hypothetical protein
VNDHTDPARGEGIVRLAQRGTAVLLITSLAGIGWGTGGVVHAVASGLAFVTGTVCLVWAYAVGVSRSRTDLVSVPGLFLLAGDVAPAATRQRLRVALLVEVLAVVTAASVRPYTEVAFGVLAPTFALGLMALWGARHGDFPARPAKQLPRQPDGHGGECADG